MLVNLYEFSKQKSAWWCLFIGSSLLVASALYFQHVLGHQPCVMCIYQRTAMIGVMLAALIPLLHNSRLTRFSGLTIWGVSSVWGYRLASEHIDILTAPNPFFAPCDIVPNFPSFMPLYDWLPNIFGAPGDCLDQSWQFLNMGMPEWMQVIYAVLTGILVFVLFLKVIFLAKHRR